jgi:hypothetical protein
MTFATPTLAYNTLGPQWEWSSGNNGGGHNYNIKVCLYSDFDAPDGTFDTSVARIARVQDAMNKINNLGTELNYQATDTACANLGASVWWVGVGWGHDHTDGAYGETFSLTQQPFCFTYCMKTAEIIIDKDDHKTCCTDIQTGDSWYVGAGYDMGDHTYSFEMTMLHELGHASGLGHSNNEAAIMCGTGDQWPDPETCNRWDKQYDSGNEPGEVSDPTLKSDDISGLNAIWD